MCVCGVHVRICHCMQDIVLELACDVHVCAKTLCLSCVEFLSSSVRPLQQEQLFAATTHFMQASISNRQSMLVSHVNVIIYASVSNCSDEVYTAILYKISVPPFTVVGIVLCMVVSLLVIVTLVLAVTVCNLKRKGDYY